ncbi:cytochrome c oxidase assembly protein [Paenibacillus thermoaerophilus]|uniref:Cytochrome c oxidase assembly protein n=1 Tax=Paenibacillus thermoaerophilus TaxID=1215385 RepID=A0ABW2UXV4_9BACL|nr:cytochrome c oxidase assembly protein [Paenibacillus thermoaerophilus]TMV19129.1 hypothetical protein FE781_01060 [Paenibacillus thermoaerophilus]
MTMGEYADWAGLSWWDPALPSWWVLGMALYMLLVSPLGRYRRSLGGEYPGLAHRLAAAGGIWAAVIALTGPLAVWSHLMVSWHMAQSALLYFVAVPLLIRSLPSGSTGSDKAVSGQPSAFGRPLLSYAGLGLFALLFTLHHLPPVMAWTLSSPSVHYGERALLLAASAAMWWPVAAATSGTEPSRARGGPHASLGIIALLPACLLTLVPGIGYERLAEAAWTAGWCMPSSGGQPVLPPWPPGWDGWIGSAVMMSVHWLAFRMFARKPANRAALCGERRRASLDSPYPG